MCATSRTGDHARFCAVTPWLPDRHTHPRHPPSPRTRLQGGAAGLREVLGDLNRSPRACLLKPVLSGQHTGCDSHAQGTRGCWDGPRLSAVVGIVPGPHCAVYLLMKAPRGSPVIHRGVGKETGSVNKPVAASWALPGFLGPPGESARSVGFRLGGGCVRVHMLLRRRRVARRVRVRSEWPRPERVPNRHTGLGVSLLVPAVGLHRGQWRDSSLWPSDPFVSGAEAWPWDPRDPYPVPMT